MTLPTLHAALALQLGGATPLGLTRQWLGITALAIFVAAYLAVVFEEKLQLRKSKPVVLAAGLIWVLIAVGFHNKGDVAGAGEALRENLLDFGELFLFILVATTFVNTMQERQVFEALRAWLVRKGLTLRSLFWATGLLSFVLSAWLDNLTTALVIGTVLITVGKGHPKFIAVGCINVVVAANAGGAFTPFGDITSLMVWQAGKLGFTEFFAIFGASLVTWLIPAFIMSLTVPKDRPGAQDVHVAIRTGGLGVVALFATTIAITVSFNNFLHLPPVLGMMTGLGLLNFYAYYLHRRYGEFVDDDVSEPDLPLADEPDAGPDGIFAPVGGGLALAAAPAGMARARAAAPARRAGAFDIFKVLQRAEWDTLLFFYGVIMCVGGLATIGYLSWLSHAMYTGLGATWANALVGVISSVVDNIPVMFSVLSMNPVMDKAQWQLVTLTTGVGGSMLSVGSAAGVALMGQARGVYTFMSHLKWTWAIALGYVVGIWLHILISGV